MSSQAKLTRRHYNVAKMKVGVDEKDTTKPSAPTGSDAARAFSWCLIQPRWEPGGEKKLDN